MLRWICGRDEGHGQSVADEGDVEPATALHPPLQRLNRRLSPVIDGFDNVAFEGNEFVPSSCNKITVENARLPQTAMRSSGPTASTPPRKPLIN